MVNLTGIEVTLSLSLPTGCPPSWWWASLLRLQLLSAEQKKLQKELADMVPCLLMAETIFLPQPHSLQQLIFVHHTVLSWLVYLFCCFLPTLGLCIAEQTCWLEHSASLQGSVWGRESIANQQGVIRNLWPLLPRLGLQQPTSCLRATRAVRVSLDHGQLQPGKETGPARARACFAFC